MSLDATNSVLGPNGLPNTAANPDADRQEVKRLAQQFEAMLLTQMMREMRKSMLDDESDQGGLGMNAMVDTGDIAFGDALSRNGGFGFTSQMLGAFERQIQAIGAKSSATALSGSVTQATGAPNLATGAPNLATNAPMLTLPSAAPVAMPLAVPSMALPPTEAAASDVTEPSRVSSAFGWRKDPISGAHKFHAGVDIAVAYGRDVKAAAEGVVAFAGSQNGYGNTVVIDHGAGRQTRYAHLSDSLVKAGDRVAEGQVVGKSGNSGRSTGPHLHFEMLVNGQAVDPLGSAL